VGEWASPVEGFVIPDSFANFYRGKKVLVTGHTGFKGGWLVSWLKLLGANVIGFALPPEAEPNLFTAARVAEGMTSVFGDIRDLPALSAVFKQHNPEIVVHNAAQPLVRRSYREPVETYATNVMGTVHVLEAARHTPSVRALVVVTSDKCYDNREWFWGYREADAMGGHDPYSSSKGAAELVAAGYRKSFFSQNGSAGVGSARAGNVIGGGDWSEDRLVPDIVRGISSGEPVVIRCPQSVRPWQHVLEPVRGYLILAQRLFEDGLAHADGWNFGPRDEDAITVSDLAQRMVSLWGKGELKIELDPAAVHEAQYLRLNCDKARTQLGWQPLLTLDEALAWTMEWYRNYYRSPGTACSTTLAQIERYMQAAAS
jgi:CDP-glucose 4,6-dehydratase